VCSLFLTSNWCIKISFLPTSFFLCPTRVPTSINKKTRANEMPDESAMITRQKTVMSVMEVTGEIWSAVVATDHHAPSKADHQLTHFLGLAFVSSSCRQRSKKECWQLHFMTYLNGGKFAKPTQEVLLLLEHKISPLFLCLLLLFHSLFPRT
jgi:hypothetical protein